MRAQSAASDFPVSRILPGRLPKQGWQAARVVGRHHKLSWLTSFFLRGLSSPVPNLRVLPNQAMSQLL